MFGLQPGRLHYKTGLNLQEFPWCCVPSVDGISISRCHVGGRAPSMNLTIQVETGIPLMLDESLARIYRVQKDETSFTYGRRRLQSTAPHCATVPIDGASRCHTIVDHFAARSHLPPTRAPGIVAIACAFTPAGVGFWSNETSPLYLLPPSAPLSNDGSGPAWAR